MKVHIWVLQPILFSTACFLMLLYPAQVRQTFPNWALWSTDQPQLAQLVMRVPDSKYDCWRLGELSSLTQVMRSTTMEDLGLPDHPGDNETHQSITEILGTASSIAKWRFASVDELTAVGDVLKDAETTHTGLSSRVWAYMTLLNSALFVLIGCMLVLFAIAIWPILCPILEVLWFAAVKAQYVLEPFFYACAAFALVQSLYYRDVAVYSSWTEPLSATSSTLPTSSSTPSPSDNGFYVGLLGIGVYLLLLIYSASEHETASGKQYELKRTAFLFMILSVLAPCALLYNSRFLGAMTVLCLEFMFGFAAGSYGLTYYVGFHDDDPLNRTIGASWLQMVLFGALRLHPTTAAVSSVFAWGFKMIGVNVYFLALLIASFGAHRYHRQPREVAARCLMVVSLIVAFYVGNVMGVEAENNIAWVYLAFFLLELYDNEVKVNPSCEAIKWFFFVTALAGGVWYVKNHPKLLIALYSN